MYRRLRTVCALVVSVVALCLPASAHAGDYWAYLGTDNGQPALSCGVNGFACYTHGGPWQVAAQWASAYPGSYIAGAHGIVRFNVPPGTVVLEGIADGTYSTPSSCARLLVERPGGTPDYTSSFSAGPGAWSAGWGVIPSYIDFQLEFTCASSPTTTGNHFWLNDFKVKIRDGSAPGLAVLAGANAPGWRGPGCHALRYAWSDAGSQMWTTYLHNLSTNQGIHSWTHNPGQTVVASGVPTADFTPCVSAPGTGTYSYRVAGMDMSSNWNHHDFPISFDVTAPTIAAPQYGGSAVNDGRVFTGTHQGYKPEITWAIGDAHSGVASIVTRFAGQTVPHTLAGGVVTLKPASKLPLGTHTLQVVVTDNVGNQTTVNRSVVIADRTPPTLVVSAPTANGSNSPVLDVTASDDSSSTWKVFVNGVQLPAASGSSQLQASIGDLVNGSHAIRVQIKDVAGNEFVHTITHVASSAAHTPPGTTGIFVLGSPSVVDEGDEYHVTAMAARDGRPVNTGRFEIARPGGGPVIAGKLAGPDGYVDMLATFHEPGPMQLALTGSQLEPAQITYTYRKIGEPDYCSAHPQHPACQTTSGGPGGDGSGTGGGSGPAGTGTSPTGISGVGSTPAATSGSPNDHVPPVFTSKLVPTKPGMVVRRKRIPIRLRSNERAGFTITPAGSRATRVGFRKAQTRTVQLGVTGKLLKRLRAARGKPIKVRIRFIAMDGNKNVRRRTLIYRIRG